MSDHRSTTTTTTYCTSTCQSSVDYGNTKKTQHTLTRGRLIISLLKEEEEEEDLFIYCWLSKLVMQVIAQSTAQGNLRAFHKFKL